MSWYADNLPRSGLRKIIRIHLTYQSGINENYNWHGTLQLWRCDLAGYVPVFSGLSTKGRPVKTPLALNIYNENKK